MSKRAFSFVAVLLAATVHPVEAQQAEWKGTWQDEAQSMISITENHGFIEVSGKDAASIYGCTGIIRKNIVECFGSGVSHEGPVRFLYKSQLTIADDKQTIEERWEASFAGGLQKSGKTTFKRSVRTR